ncbi:CHAT domain-containing protein [Chloroflexales bacterium ZM16-3]|nr:CHAT domain-containing protein [Chloroflexales bacterium ZM16-3]
MSDDNPLLLTLDFINNGGQAIIRWYSEVLDGDNTDFVPPYASSELPVVIKALDTLQRPQSFGGEEIAVLEHHGLWEHGFVTQRAAHQVGSALYTALGHRGQAHIEQTIGHARLNRRSINYRLRFLPEGVELAALPWELLRSPRHFLLMRPDGRDSCERNILFGQPPPPALAEGETPHVLVLLPHFAIDATIRAAQLQIFERLQSRGALTYEALSPVTPDGLYQHLAATRRQPHIVHYAGHGVYFEQQGWLLFDDLKGGKQRVSAEQFSTLVGTIHLAVIQACQSAMVSKGELLTGVAPALSYATDAVVAMQLHVRVDAAHRFAETLYEELLIRATSLRSAVARARRNLFGTEQEPVSWFVPALYLRVEPQFASRLTPAGSTSLERTIVRSPIRQIALDPLVVGHVELTLSCDPRTRDWSLVAHNHSPHEVESITITAGQMPPGIRIHPPQIRIARARAGDSSAPEAVTLTLGSATQGSRIPVNVTYRVRQTGQIGRYTGAFTVQLADEG